MKKHELFAKKELITKIEWDNHVDSWYKNDSSISEEQVKNTIKNAILSRIAEEKVGVMFSGGIDSTLIAKILIDEIGKENVVLVSVGCHDEGRKYPEDLEEAKVSAEELGAEWHAVILSEEETQKVFDKTISILREAGDEYVNSVNVSVGAVEVAAYKEFLRLGIKQVFGGLGSEEVFAGYLRHEQSENVKETSRQSLKDMFNRDLVREYHLAKHFSMISNAPFMDEELLKLTFCMPEAFKIHEGENKFLVRKLGEELGLGNAYRKKRAAQYGSRTQAFLEKICNKKGYKTIKECLQQWN
jgi:asparagine synthetase B (glutamine-hydrolysing)